ncbi:MAG: NAD(P)-binding oxidoreductase [Candidatus Saccharibacteria bacterium]
MRVLVIGGSRGIGRQTVKYALEKGYFVTVFSRNPSAIGITNPKLKLHAGNVLDPSSLEAAMSDSDIVICALGLSTRQALGPPLSKASHVLSTGTRNILSAMSTKHVKRLICVTAIGTGNSAGQCSFITRLTLRHGLRWLFKEKDIQEQLIEESTELNWTILRPTALTNGKRKGATVNDNLRAGFFTHISRADVASYMIDIIDQKTTHNKALILSYPPKIGDSVRFLTGYLGLI